MIISYKDWLQSLIFTETILIWQKRKMAAFLGSIGLKVASKATSESKRDDTEPFIMFGYDRQINFISMAIPGVVLGFAVTMCQENDLI